MNEVDYFAQIYRENLNTYSHIEEDYKIDNLFEKHVLRKMKIKPTSDWIGSISIWWYWYLQNEDIKDNYYDLTFQTVSMGLSVNMLISIKNNK